MIQKASLMDCITMD